MTESKEENCALEQGQSHENVGEIISDGEHSCNKYTLTNELKDKLRHMPDVLEFIMMLQKYIEKQKKILKKIKTKLKKSKAQEHVACQTEIEVPVENESKEAECESTEVKCEGDNPRSFAEEIKEAAEQALQSSGFVYEETSGMYYDYNTGYYYNVEYGLYYDGNTGTYMKYNQETQQYEFHSQVAIPDSELSQTQDSALEKTKRKKTRRKNDSKAQKRKCMDQNVDNIEGGSDLEEGECSFSSSEESPDSNEENDEESSNSENSDISKQWPPCMRIIVEETSVLNLKTGTLYIITFEGGTLGREGHHSILLTDVNVSKHHLKFSFDKETNKYLVTDLGSRNGTLLNGKRVSSSKQESEPMEIVHGSKIQVGSSVLLCHIHDGNQTCGHCEPGLVQNSIEDKARPVRRLSRASKSEKHKNELKNLRKKFGVASYEEGPSKLATGYTDRAQKRRDTVGSQNPHEKTQVASLEESIPKENKGFKLLSKMGWKEGQSLGKEGQGIVEPVKLVSNPGNAGIGSDVAAIDNVAVDENKQKIWKKTQDRYEKLPETNSAFEETD